MNSKVNSSNYGLHVALKELNKLKDMVASELDNHKSTNSPAGYTKRLVIADHFKIIENDINELIASV